MSINMKSLHHSHVVYTRRVRITILNRGDIGDGRENMAVKNDSFGICLETGAGVADIKRGMSFIHQIIGHYPIVRLTPGHCRVSILVAITVRRSMVIGIKKRFERIEGWFRVVIYICIASYNNILIIVKVRFYVVL